MKHLWPPVIWALLILVLCGMPGKDIPHISFLEILAFDKWVHAGVFFLLALLMIRGIYLQYHWEVRKIKALTLVFCVVYGGALELMQDAVFSDRSADAYDFTANAFGAICGVWLYRTFVKRIRFFMVHND